MYCTCLCVSFLSFSFSISSRTVLFFCCVLLTRTTSQLNRHIRVLHEQQRPYLCPICPEPRAFGRKSVLHRHMQTHDDAATTARARAPAPPTSYEKWFTQHHNSINNRLDIILFIILSCPGIWLLCLLISPNPTTSWHVLLLHFVVCHLLSYTLLVCLCIISYHTKFRLFDPKQTRRLWVLRRCHNGHTYIHTYILAFTYMQTYIHISLDSTRRHVDWIWISRINQLSFAQEDDHLRRRLSRRSTQKHPFSL